MFQFIGHIRKYVDDILDVEADGNCGFRVIASLHGYCEYGWSIARRYLDNEIRARLGL